MGTLKQEKVSKAMHGFFPLFQAEVKCVWSVHLPGPNEDQLPTKSHESPCHSAERHRVSSRGKGFRFALGLNRGDKWVWGHLALQEAKSWLPADG